MRLGLILTNGCLYRRRIILAALGVSRVRLITNNPDKMAQLEQCGVNGGSAGTAGTGQQSA